MSDHTDLVAQAQSLAYALEQTDAEIERREGELVGIRADRETVAQRLGAVERFLESEGAALPYSNPKGV
jgi:hypothetical protein